MAYLEKHLAFIQNKISTAELTVLVGAGFSLDVKDSDGKGLPLGSHLAEEIWNEYFPNEEYDKSSSLTDVYEIALDQNSKKLDTFMKRRFNVNVNSIPDYYYTYLNFPWKKIYTLNVDNLFQKMSIDKNKGRSLNIITPFFNQSVRRDNLTVDLIHLNGSLDELPDRVTFSKRSYTQRGIYPDHLYSELSSEIMTSPFIFIGTIADEAELWKYIELRKLKGNVRGRHEKRPRSFVVMPKLSSTKKKMLESFNVYHLPYSAKEFAELLKSNFSNEISDGLKIVESKNSYSKRESIKVDLVSELRMQKDPSVKLGDEYLLGAEPSWEDIREGRTIEREQVTSWVNTLIEQIESKKNLGVDRTAFSILSTAGDGKSTIAKQIAVSVDSAGHTIGWIDRESDLRVFEIEKAIKNSPKIDLLIIDDADLFGVNLADKLVELYNEGMVQAVLCCMRSAKVDNFLGENFLTPYRYDEFVVNRLTESEIDDLVRLLDKQNRLGVLKSKTHEERVQVFIEHCNQELIVAMIEATSGKKLEEKVASEFSELEGKEKEIYAVISCATYFRHSLSKEDLIIIFPDIQWNELFETLEKMIRRGLLRVSRTDTIVLRHRLIADIVIESIIENSNLLHYFEKIVNLAITRIKCETDPVRYKRILKSFMNHNMIQRVANSLETGRRYFSGFEEQLKNDFNFWLQFGCYELDSGDLSRSRNLLNQASGLNGTHSYVITAIANLDFKEACCKHNVPNMAAQADKAFRTLQDQITYVKGKDPYHYHILGHHGSKWAQKAITDRDERYQYLLSVKSIVDEGLKLHPDDERLENIAKEIKRDVLYLRTV